MKKKILIADDEFTIRELLEMSLDEDYEVDKANDGEEAIKKAKNKPDLIILDVMMPKIDGYEVCNRLKSSKETRDIPIIMLTVKHTAEDLKKAISCNVDEFMTKPFEPEILKKRVDSYLNKEKQKAKLSQFDRTIHYIKGHDS